MHNDLYNLHTKMPIVKTYLTTFIMLLVCVRKGAHGWVLSVCSHQTRPIMWFSFPFSLSLISYHHAIFKLNEKLAKEIYPLLWQVDIDGDIMCCFARFSGDLHDHRTVLLLCPLNQLSKALANHEITNCCLLCPAVSVYLGTNACYLLSPSELLTISPGTVLTFIIQEQSFITS